MDLCPWRPRPLLFLERDRTERFALDKDIDAESVNVHVKNGVPGSCPASRSLRPGNAKRRYGSQQTENAGANFHAGARNRPSLKHVRESDFLAIKVAMLISFGLFAASGKGVLFVFHLTLSCFDSLFIRVFLAF
ncbi:hypothetical protein PH552_16795 [Rhizobium sp. CNPSo 3968]|uniref:hypothetical protein n=1 Tax=Rhizobium sp. CNPSo 3968 TaxID=3021408 RepID=UPI00254F3CA6|nr:hypothetical protein [Rhizobium sp. CNPSo 3968]MDK4721004.1 hypothetical protein [Rhizobium sp. CNPSo 3968]